MKKLIQLLVLLEVLLYVISCNKGGSELCENNEKINELPIYSIEDSCSCTCRISDELKDLQFVIQDQSEFDNLINCNEEVKIDFSKFTLLAGQKVSPWTGGIKSQKLSLDCKKQEFLYHVIIYQGLGQARTVIPFFALVPKLPNKYKINFDVEIEY